MELIIREAVEVEVAHNLPLILVELVVLVL
jgi:hypothetical protein